QIIGSCFPAGTLVRMADGSERPIEDVREGEEVVSHTGQARRVLRTFSRDYTGDLVTMRAAAHPFPLTATEDHRIATVPFRGSKFTLRAADLDRFRWTEAGDLDGSSRVLVGRMETPVKDPSIVIDVKEILGDEAVEIDAIRRGESPVHSQPAAAAVQLEKDEQRSGVDLSGRVTLWKCRYKY